MPLNHVALTVADRERSAIFYGEHFGLTERVHDDEHLLILGAGDGSLLALSEGDCRRGCLAPTTSAFSSATQLMFVGRVSAYVRPPFAKPNGRTIMDWSACGSPIPTDTESSCLRTDDQHEEIAARR